MSKEQMERETAERESELRQVQEERFCKEKKHLQGMGAKLKRADIIKNMEKCKDDETVQTVGNKMI